MYAENLNARRRSLDMSFAALAQRSGLALATVQRILNGKQEPSSANLKALADALGMVISIKPKVAATKFKRDEARAKARRLVALNQGTAALEAQAVSQQTLNLLIEQTVQQLLAKPKHLLWSN